MKSFLADLHIHSALSPCAGDEMTPPAIVQTAIDNGLAMIAICDHNAAGNTAVTQKAAAHAAGGHLASGGCARNARSLTVLAGIEITTSEEVHLLGLFASAADALATADAVRATLPDATDASRRRFGDQRLLDADGRVVGMEPKLLATASTLALSGAVQLVRQNHGLAVAAHVNRPSFSVLSQLGIFPQDAGFDAIEIFKPCGPHPGMVASIPHGQPAADSAAAQFASFGLPVISSSDAHFLADIGRARTAFTMKSPTFEELALALQGIGGRTVACA
ncbi:MAG TPA: PHP-associated domain-containing protein [Phycisphaerae bacterium]|nr:PHP-associated domain-containing protein [Phycisphaerae bacterium]